MAKYEKLLITGISQRLLDFHANWMPTKALSNLKGIKQYFNSDNSGAEDILDDFISTIQGIIDVDSDGIIVQRSGLKLSVLPLFDLITSMGGLVMITKELRELRESMTEKLSVDNIESYKLLSRFLDDYIEFFEGMNLEIN